MIRLIDVEVRFDGVTALRLPRLEIEAGERVGVEGPNGAGKSTLLRVMAGLLEPSAGSVEGLPPPGRTVLVHQRPYMLRGTARSNVAYALRVAGRPEAEADAWLRRLGAGSLADRDGAVLSGGECRRVAIARALAVAPEVLLLDEPFAALDDEGHAAVVQAIEAFEGTVVVAAPDLVGAPVSRRVSLEAAG